MRRKRNKTDEAGLLVLCALLCIWICAIILPVKSESIPVEARTVQGPLPVLIIDPGHGGLDGGASTADGVPESRFNLEIAGRLRDMASFLGISTYMTREGETLSYPEELKTIAACKRWDTRRRVEEINSIGNGVLMSIHQNAFPSSAPRGAQVIHAPDGESRRFGEATQAMLTEKLLPDNRRVAEPASRDLYILQHVRCPAILVECGFLSHPEEAARLAEEGYQIRLSAILAVSFLQFTEDVST